MYLDAGFIKKIDLVASAATIDLLRIAEVTDRDLEVLAIQGSIHIYRRGDGPDIGTALYFYII